MSIYSFLLLPLLLIGFPGFAAHEQVPLMGEGDLHFELTHPKQRSVIVPTSKKVIELIGGDFRGILAEAEKKNEVPTRIILGRIDNIASFRAMIKIMEKIAEDLQRVKQNEVHEQTPRIRSELDIRNCDELSSLLIYAQRYNISYLGEAIALFLESNKFKIPFEEIRAVEPVLRLGTALSSIIGRNEGAINDWNSRVLKWLVKHILIYSHLDSSYKKVYDRLKRAFRDDELMLNYLTPSAEIFDECKTQALAIKAQQRNAEAQEVARELKYEVNSQYAKNFFDQKDGAIFIRVKADLALEIAEALRAETQHAFDIQIYPAEEVPDDMCCCTSFSSLSETNACQNAEHTIAYIVSTIFNWIGPQIAQCISSGYCFRGFRDCQAGISLGELCRNALTDGRTGQAIYTCVYDSLTAMGNCCRGNGCQGPTKTLRMTRKPFIFVPDEEHKH